VSAGRRLAIDFGDARIGLAMSDPSGFLASPMATIKNGSDREEILKKLRAIVLENEIVTIYIGLPLLLSGEEGAAAEKTRNFARELSTQLPDNITIKMIDERLTTVSAEKNARARGHKLAKSEIDQFAATAILESALQSERNREESSESASE
jgi:putative Holliday junction resolvase